MALAWQGQKEKADIRKNTASKQCAQTRAEVTDNTNTTNNLVSPSKKELSQTRTRNCSLDLTACASNSRIITQE